jgi:hypothetical protein
MGMHLALTACMKITRLLIPGFALTTGFGSSACDLCGPEQHAITTSANTLTLGGEFGTRQIQFVNVHLTEPPATHDDMQFVFNTLEGSTTGEGVALTFSGTDAITQEIVTLTLALPVTLREGDDYAVGSTFNVEVGTTDPAMWGSHDLQQSNKADAAFVIATYSFPPPVYTTTYRAVSSSGTIHVADRSNGHVQLQLNLSFADATGKTRTVTGNVQANSEKSSATCS